MKIDRLIGITMYLLNRNIVPAKELAERFEVSIRTIVRDIEALTMAGIPVSSSTGAAGGYEILDTFKLNKQITTVEDYLSVITALKAVCSAYDNKHLNATLEMMLATGHNTDDEQRVFIDFGVVTEDGVISNYVRMLEGAIERTRVAAFEYTDSTGRTNSRTVEPLALNYRWYAWYLLGYCRYKNDYRFFKLNRISQLRIMEDVFLHNHGSIPELLERQWNSDSRSCIAVKLICKAEARVAVTEYLKPRIIEQFDNGDLLMEIHAVENERIWYSLLMGFGGDVSVLEPQCVVDMIKGKCEDILRG